MRKVSTLFATVALTLFAGCASGSRRAERELLSRHPLAKTRMSVEGTNDYTFAGVWRIRGASNVVYLAGTSHLVAADQAPFPSPFYAAYNDSREIYVEYDTHSFFGQLQMIPKAVKWVHAHKSEFVCPRGTTISNYVSPETIEKLKAHYGTKEFRKQENATPLLLLFLNEFEA